MDLGLRDLVVVVTGGSGGIGQALVSAFGAEGARVAATARTLPLRADVTRPAEVDAVFAEVAEAHGRVDVCIANAGIWPAEPLPLHDLPEARLREVLEVNLLGAIHTARAFLKILARTGPRDDGRGASLCFIGSTAGRFGERGHAEYAVSKTGLYGLVRSLKNEIVALDPRARVNLVEPGWTLTPMAEPAMGSDAIAAATRTMPLRQLARPEDIAHAVLFFASPTCARHVTGEVLTVAGGMEGRVQWEG